MRQFTIRGKYTLFYVAYERLLLLVFGDSSFFFARISILIGKVGKVVPVLN
jgi:hypothetical protein